MKLWIPNTIQVIITIIALLLQILGYIPTEATIALIVGGMFLAFYLNHRNAKLLRRKLRADMESLKKETKNLEEQLEGKI